MNRLLVIFVSAALACGSLLASIEGTVVNRTSGKPQARVTITLVKPGAQGMQTLASTVSDGAGKFRFTNDQPQGGPELLQASYKSVNYNKLLTPNIPTTDVNVDVYEATSSASVARVAQRMLLLEPSAGRINVDETVIVQNEGNVTFTNHALGAIRFYLPPAANDQVRVNARGPQGMPLPCAPEKAQEDDVFKVQFPIKPGETEFQISYVLPVGSPFTFRDRVVNVTGMPSGPLRLVAPSGVRLAGKSIQQVGTEPTTQASIYNVTASRDFSVDISGTGALHNDADASSADTSDSPRPTEGQPQIYTHIRLLVALVFSILAVGLVILFRSSPLRLPYGK